MKPTRLTLLGWCALALCVIATPIGSALAQNFDVVTVPWVGTAPSVPHDGVVDQPHYLQAVARNCEGAIEFRWDHDGDGMWDTEWAAAPNRWNLATTHTYAELDATRLFIARVEGRCDGEANDIAEFPIRVHVDPTLTQRANRAVSNGLWYGHTALTRDPANMQAHWGEEVGTAMMAQAMINRGHKAGVDPAIDPYLEDVQWMLHYVASHLEVRDIAGQLQQGEDPDVNANGIALRFRGEENYAGGGCLEMIASWGDMDYVLPEAGQPANVAGRRLGDVVQDASEYFFWSQSEVPFLDGFAGGWDYSVNARNIDSSQIGWSAVGLFAAEVNGGVQTPQWVKDRLYLGINYMDTGRARTGEINGAYGYRTPGDMNGNAARSGAMLNGLGFSTDGDQGDVAVQTTVDFIAAQFDAPQADGFSTLILGNFYAMYQVAKGMRSFEPQFTVIGEGVDWYQRIATWLVDNQPADGRWNNDQVWTRAREVTHGIGLLVLIPTLFEAPPTAVAGATPSAAGPGDEITFFHGGSYNLDPGSPITTWRWNFINYPVGLDLNGDGDFEDDGEHAPEDLNGDGVVTPDEIVWEVVTNDPEMRPTWTFNPEIEFGEQVFFPVVLQVEDTEGRTSLDRESVVIEVSYTNHAPVAVGNPAGAGVPYMVPAGRAATLDASGSFDPDLDDEPAPGFPRDSLTFVGWDLDGDGEFETEGLEAEVPVPEDAPVGGSIVVRLMVCDDGTWIGTPDEACEGGDCSLCATSDARIIVDEYVPQPPVIELAGDGIYEVDEGGMVAIDASGTSSPDELAFELLWYCQDMEILSTDDPFVGMADARMVDAPAEPIDFDCVLTAIDELGNISEAPFTVRVSNVEPTIEGVELSGDPLEGETLEVRIAADDVPGDAPFLLYSVDCDGDGTFEVRNTRNNVVECPLDDGVYAPVVRVDDQEGGVTEFELDTFEVENVAPTFDEVVCPAVEEGRLMVLEIGVSDPADRVFCGLGRPTPEQAQLTAADCTLVWTPTYGQALAGQVDFTVMANDGDGGMTTLEFSCFPTLRDLDGDGLPDSWEERFGTDPSVDDCELDYDGDGLDNCEEYADGTHPLVFEGPATPTLLSPIGGEIVDTATPRLVSGNTVDTRGLPLSYVYMVYDSFEADAPFYTSPPVGEMPAETWHEVPFGELEENRTYYWTVAATNGRATGPSPERTRFAVDAVEEPAPAPIILSPDDGDTSPDGVPPIVLTTVEDPDPGDTLIYECVAALDPEGEEIVGIAEGQGDGAQAQVEFEDLPGDATYFIRCRGVDQDGNPGEWSDDVVYAVNHPPVAAVDPPVLELAEGSQGPVRGEPSFDRDGGELRYDWRCPAPLIAEPLGDTVVISARNADGTELGETYQCRLTVTDAHGASDETVFVVRVNNTPPMAQAECPPTTEGVPTAIPIITSDFEGDFLSCEWDAAWPMNALIADCAVLWTPTYDQALAGVVPFNVVVKDDDGGVTPVSFTCAPQVLDADGNGVPDTWQDENDIEDCADDRDGDGVADCDEYLEGTDPDDYDGPSPLALVSPIADEIVDTDRPILVVTNATDGLDRPLSYRYAIFEGPDSDEPVALSDLVPEVTDLTDWMVPADTLAENARYYWSAQADNGVGAGPWAAPETFWVNATPEPPTAPTILRPMSGDAVDDTPVRVSLQNSTDPDPGAELNYICEVAADDGFDPVVGMGAGPEGDEGTSRVDIEALLDENEGYVIRCKAIDETGLESPWSDPVKISIDRTNEPPSQPSLNAPEPYGAVDMGEVDFEVGGSIDPEGDALTYHIQVSADADFLEVFAEDSAPAGEGNLTAFGPYDLSPGTWYYRAWAHDGLLAGPMTTTVFEVIDPNPPEDTINGGGCACDVDGEDPTSPIAIVLGVMLIGLSRRRRR